MSSVADLAALYLAATSPDWTETPHPTLAAYDNATLFLRSLPSEWPAPDIDIDRDGEFDFYWILAPGRRLSLAIRPDARVPYAWMDGESRGHDVDEMINGQLRRRWRKC